MTTQDSGYVFTRFLLLRLLGLVSLFAFQGWLDQGAALVGRDGLLPVDLFLERIEQMTGSKAAAFVELPTLFHFGFSDRLLFGAAALGWVLSLLCLFGRTNMVALLTIWVLHLSLNQIGQRFWAYGWENQLAETVFLAAFLVPVFDSRPLASAAPPFPVIVLFRWLVFRVMLGAGLIKLRGDPCWADLSCLDFHFETQPIPNPLTALFHFAPDQVRRAGVLFNHFAEVVVPFGVFGPRRVRHAAGVILVAFQLTIIASGNFSFLNWLTIVAALACFDDGFWRRLLPSRLLPGATVPTSSLQRRLGWGVAALIVILSPPAAANLLSSEQRMNFSYDPLKLVNSHGNFGSIGRLRHEVVIEGTQDSNPDTARWQAYEFPCKPGAPDRRPCVTSPYQPRLAWQLWFAAMSRVEREPWLVHLLYKLLEADPTLLELVEHDPFAGERPRFVRALLYRYELAEGDVWWKRTLVGQYAPPLSREDPSLHAYLRAVGLSRGIRAAATGE